MSQVLQYPYGEAQTKGSIKQQPEDFRVDENLGFDASGEGEHLLILVEKSGFTTTELIERVASDFGIKARDVGYSGLKDKQAITRQWLSLYLPGQMNTLQIPASSDYRLIEHGWHNRKLRPGTHRSNRFQINVRDVASYPQATQQQVDKISRQGFANYFGTQRFGQQQDNVAQALRHFSNQRRSRKLSRSKKSLYISALRSFLFNQVLTARIAAGDWDEPRNGDVYMLAGSHSIFYEAVSPEIRDRYQRLDISSTASLYGKGKRMLEDDAKELEDRIFSEYGDITNCLLEQEAKLQMRNIRTLVEDFAVDYHAAEQLLVVTVTLPSGCYLTTLLSHFVDISAS